METQTHCQHCGASLKAYWHNLSTGLVSALVKAIKYVHTSKKNEFHLTQNLNLTKSEYNNFQKLRFHGLVAKVDGKAGYWLITRRGGQFLRGEIAVPQKVKTFRNQVLEHSIQQVHINELKHKVPQFESEFAYEYQRVEELQGNLNLN